MISRRNLLRLAGGSAGLMALGAADALAIEPRFALTVKHWHVRHPAWPAEAAPLRIGILTDIHAVEPYMPASRIADIAARLNSMRPDVIVLLGDFVASLTSRYRTGLVSVADWTAALAQLKAPLGVYAVLGNHDWWTEKVPAIRREFAKTSIRLLENTAIGLRHGDSPFWLAGLGDQLAYGSYGVADLPGTLEQTRGDAPVILLAHEPEIFSKIPKRVALTLSGHTHGGQVYVPVISERYLHPRIGGKYTYGHYTQNGGHLVVSAGLGVSVLPIRFLVPPEITMVTLSHGGMSA